MPSKYIKDDTYEIIVNKVVEYTMKTGEPIKDSEVIERLLRLGIEKEKELGLIVKSK